MVAQIPRVILCEALKSLAFLSLGNIDRVTEMII